MSRSSGSRVTRATHSSPVSSSRDTRRRATTQQPGYPPPGYSQQPGYGYVPQYAADPSAPWGRDPLTGLPLSDKSKVTAGLLQILLGGFGVGRFYLGYTTIGVLQLVVSLVTCGIGAIWPLIDGIMILMGNVPDTQGRKLRD